MCLERTTWRRVGRSFTVVLFGVLLIGAVTHWASPVLAQQSQDYINGLVEGQLRALGQRLDNIEKLLYFLGTCIAGVLITQWVGLRNQRDDKRKQLDAEDARNTRTRARGGRTARVYQAESEDEDEDR